MAWREKSRENLGLYLMLLVVQLREENPRIPRAQGALEAVSIVVQINQGILPQCPDGGGAFG